MCGNIVVSITEKCVPVGESKQLLTAILMGASTISKKEAKKQKFDINGQISYSAAVPVVLPLFPHKPRVEGAITSDVVQLRMHSYGSEASFFLEAALYQKSNSNSHYGSSERLAWGIWISILK